MLTVSLANECVFYSMGPLYLKLSSKLVLKPCNGLLCGLKLFKLANFDGPSFSFNSSSSQLISSLKNSTTDSNLLFDSSLCFFSFISQLLLIKSKRPALLVVLGFLMNSFKQIHQVCESCSYANSLK